MRSFAAFVLSKHSRDTLKSMFPATYPEKSLNHITIQFGTEDEGLLFEPKEVQVTGYVDDGRGIEALLVEIDDEKKRSDGNFWHITISFDPNINVSDELLETEEESLKYSAQISNRLISHALDTDSVTLFENTIKIDVEPKIIKRKASLQTESCPISET